jgi:hypothetical protein
MLICACVREVAHQNFDINLKKKHLKIKIKYFIFEQPIYVFIHPSCIFACLQVY